MDKAKLNLVMEQIKSIIQENDLAGIVVLYTPGIVQYHNGISPSFSCAKLIGKEIEFKLHKKHYDNDLKRQWQVATDTSLMLHTIADALSGLAFITLDASKTLDKELGITEN